MSDYKVTVGNATKATDLNNAIPKCTAKSADFIIPDSSGDESGYSVYLVTTSTNTITATLPTLADNLGRVIRFDIIDDSTGKLVIDGEGSETINGYTLWTLKNKNETVTIIATASEWRILAGTETHWMKTTVIPSTPLINGANPTTTWTDINFTSYMSTNTKSALLYVHANGSGAATCNLGFRANGSTEKSRWRVQRHGAPVGSYVGQNCRVPVTGAICEYAEVSGACDAAYINLVGWEYDL